MAERYNQDMMDHLETERRRLTNGMDAVQEMVRNEDKFLKPVRDRLIQGIKAACGHENCRVAKAYRGRNRPAPPEPSPVDERA